LGTIELNFTHFKYKINERESREVRTKDLVKKEKWDNFGPALSQIKAIMQNDQLKKRKFVKKAIEKQKANGKYVTNETCVMKSLSDSLGGTVNWRLPTRWF
tara:strand:- start:561 stop:863 length:303 start_codon:yes stop_codon:yes gene_type:complete